MNTTLTAPAERPRAPLASGYVDCRVCGSRLVYKRQVGQYFDDPVAGVCAECHTRPEARHLLSPAKRSSASVSVMPSTSTRTSAAAPPAASPAVPRKPRAFNPAERALIRNVHSYMPTAQLLDVLNTRLVADVGAAAVPFTLEQLQAEVQQLIDPSQAGDWAGLREIIARARRCGLLKEITQQIVDDFAVVFQLSPAQHMHVRDVIRSAQEDR